ncbi:MAG: amidohydrolase family protein [Tepidiformaceae bacterium]
MGALVLRGGRVWDGLSNESTEQNIVIDGTAIGAAGSDVGGARTLDISGCTALPGLIEGHAHLCFNAQADWRAVFDSDSPSRMLLRMAANGRSMLEAGITTVRDLGAPTHVSIEVREAFASGLALGPKLLVAGAPITTTGGHCHFMGGEADGALELRKAVREHNKAGTDWIKIMATGGNMTHRTNTFAAQYTVDELRAVIADAQRLRLRVTAHAHGSVGIGVATEAGVDMIEHCSFTTPGGTDFDPQVADAIAAKGIVVSPTVSVGYRNWKDDGMKQRRKQVTLGLLERGCQVLMSTDCGIPGVPHNALAGGMQVLAELGELSPIQTLKLATSSSANILGLKDRGTLEAGKSADLLVVEGDPTVDLGDLTRVRYVLRDGEIVYRAAGR